MQFQEFKFIKVRPSKMSQVCHVRDENDMASKIQGLPIKTCFLLKGCNEFYFYMTYFKNNRISTNDFFFDHATELMVLH